MPRMQAWGKGNCYRPWVTGERLGQRAGLRVGMDRVGRHVGGGDARIGKVNTGSNDYFISQHAQGQQRVVDYSSLDDDNLRQARRARRGADSRLGICKVRCTDDSASLPLPHAGPSASRKPSARLHPFPAFVSRAACRRIASWAVCLVKERPTQLRRT